jgi:putative phage-type endonuclease
MITVSVEQGTVEWHSLRRSKIGASDCPAILGKSHYKGHTAYSIWRSKVLGEEAEVTAAMQRGKDLEAEALKAACDTFKCEFRPIVAVSTTHPWQMASLDGFNDERGTVIEIKCPGEKVFNSIEKGDIPENYMWQIQHQLAVTGVWEGILYAYNGTRGVFITIMRDESMIEELIEAEHNFWFNHVLKFDPPKLQKGDFVERNDEKSIKWAQAGVSIAESRKYLDELEEAHRAEGIALCEGVSSIVGGVKVTKVFTKGRIDYEAIPLLKDIDLEKYRKPGRESWRIS